MNLQVMTMDKEIVEIDGRKVVHTEVETIEFVYKDQIIKMCGTRIVTFEDGDKLRLPISYESLVASLEYVPIQFASEVKEG